MDAGCGVRGDWDALSRVVCRDSLGCVRSCGCGYGAEAVLNAVQGVGWSVGVVCCFVLYKKRVGVVGDGIFVIRASVVDIGTKETNFCCT